MPATATVLVLAALAALPALYLHEAAKEKRARAEFFQASASLFESYRVTQEGNNYPLLEGRYRGHAVRLEPVLDNMTARKLPSLWLKVTLFKPRPGRAVFSFLMRPDGNEFYSPGGEMARRLAIPAAWPQNAMLCTDNMDSEPDFDALDPQMALFADARAKELVASPQGVRIVYQAAQGERAHYLALRQARFALRQLDPALAAALLDRAMAIAGALDDDACDELVPQTVAA